MRVFLTGGTGFIGGRVAQRLRERGHEVVALVRSEARATALTGLGCELVSGDVTDSFAVERGLEGTDSVIHLAGVYKIGIRKSECPYMQDVNIGGVRHVLNAAVEAGIPRILFASSVTAFGDTKGQKVTEAYQRDPLKGFLSCYDGSKYRAHLLALDRINKGAPIVIVQPGAVYGPGDHSEIGRQILAVGRGELSALALTNVGLTMAYVDDVADGVLAAFESGQVGQSYVLGGESVRGLELLEKASELSGCPLPTRRVSTGMLKFIAPIGPWVAPRMGYPPNLAEVLSAADGVTYWADDTKAQTELGYKPRSLEDGLRSTLQAAGIKMAS